MKKKNRANVGRLFLWEYFGKSFNSLDFWILLLIITIISSFGGIGTQIICGISSDYSTSKYGKRKKYLVVGTGIYFVGSFIMFISCLLELL